MANIAIYLSRFGQKVCIMDFDLEAPGLHHKFPQYVKTNDIKKGLVDIIYEFSQDGTIPQTLEEFSLELPILTKSQSDIRLIPAGNMLSSDYWQKLASIDWHSLFYKEGSEGIPFFLELKERIIKEFNPDFLLIDSRTGITEMSGLCTSLLPDKVVFLIVNNQENIEGAYQILQSIQNSERFPEQKPIEVTFALTRIPFFEEDDDDGVDIQIAEDIKKYLNKPVENLEDQVNIQDICILHSDRELELSESLRIGQEVIFKETPLLRDYLRLFSKIIPEKVILPKLDEILEEIITTVELLEEPDKTQKELEGIVESYPHPKSIEKLIDFYILRNEDDFKILRTFHRLWGISGTLNSKLMSKYIYFYMKENVDSHNLKETDFEIIEKYLEFNPNNKIEVELKLAESYENNGNHGIALKHYLLLLDEIEDKSKILENILSIYIDMAFYDDAPKLFDKYSGYIDNNTFLQVKKIEILFKIGDLKEVQKLLDVDGNIETTFLDINPCLYINVMKKLGQSDKVYTTLNTSLDKALMKGNNRKIYEIGKLFYKIGKGDEFKNKVLEKDSEFSYIIHDIERSLERRTVRRRRF